MNEKMTFRQWWENYWYHYKAITWIVVFSVFVVIVCTVQLLSKDDPDVHITYAGYDLVAGSELSDINGTVTSLIEDYNGDGVKKLGFLSLQLGPTTIYGDSQVLEASKHTETMQRFQLEIAAGDSMIYFVDSYLYKSMYEKGQVVPFADSIGYVPEGAYDDCAVPITALSLYEAPGFKDLPETTLVCLRNLPDRDTYEIHRKLFQSLLEYVHEEK